MLDAPEPPAEAPPLPPKLREVGKSVAARIAREHPTLVLTIAYVLLTFVGMVHDWWFYMYFRINILDFSETTDFLVAAIRNPLVIILSLIPILILLFFQRMRETARRKSSWYDQYQKKYERSRWNTLSMRVMVYGWFIVIYAILFTQIYAKREAERIKTGKGRKVSFLRSDGIISDEQPILLGTTGKFVFLYFPSRKATEIVPIEQTVALTVDSRRRKEREADSLKAAGDSATP